MLSDSAASPFISVIFDGGCPDCYILNALLRKKLSESDLTVDLFSEGGKTLMIAYPKPPKSAGSTPHLLCGKRRLR